MGDSGKMEAVWAAWLPNLILGGIGSLVLWKRSRFVS